MDDFGKIFRGFFGFPQHRNGWNDVPSFGEKDSSEERGFGSFFNGEGSIEEDFDSMFEHFQGDLFRQMDSLNRQMEDMMRGFGGVRFPSGFQPPEQGDPRRPILPPGDSQSDDQPRQGFRIWFGTPSPFFSQEPEERRKASPRDFMLKEDLPESEEGNKGRPALPPPPEPKQEGPGRPFLPIPGFGSTRRPEKKVDTDLDGKLSDKEVLDLITKKSEPPSSQPTPQQPRMSSWGTSVSISRVQRPDGKIEEKRIVRDASGHEESTVTKSMGDQSYTVTTVIGEDGKTETKETYQNMDEKDLGTFEKQWKTPFGQRPRHPADSLMSPKNLPAEIETQDTDLFSKLFGWKGK